MTRDNTSSVGCVGGIRDFVYPARHRDAILGFQGRSVRAEAEIFYLGPERKVSGPLQYRTIPCSHPAQQGMALCQSKYTIREGKTR